MDDPIDKAPSIKASIIRGFRNFLFVASILLICLSQPCFAKGSDSLNTPAQSIPADETFYDIMTFERIVDGDTFKASGQTIRLWGINAPEKSQPYYETSTQALRAFLETGILRCKRIEQDKYGRAVMHCFSGINDLGALMVKAGFAKDFTKYSGGFYRTEEVYAREGLLGLWGSH